MIVLDTNALIGRGQGPSTSATLLRALASETGHPLAIPQEVLDEYLAKCEREIQPLIEAGDAEKLLAQVPHWLNRSAVARGVGGASLPTLTSVLYERRESITARPTSRFLVVPTPAGAAEEGIARERARRPPATESGHEARDVVVWLTVVEVANGTAPSNVYFVSSDKGFRGDSPKHLHPELRREAPTSLKFFPSVESLFDRLSCPSDPIPDIAAHPNVLNAIEQTAIHGGHDPNHDLRRDLWDWVPQGASQSDIVTVTVSLQSEPRVASRRCGDTTFTAVDAVYRLRIHYRPEKVESVDVSVRLGILVTYEDGEFQSARVLARSGIRLYAPDEQQRESNGTE